MIIRVIAILIGYIFGMLSITSYLSRKKGIDIRKTGSGNPGTTNALRVLGLKSGICVFAFDVIKSLLACLVVMILFGGDDESGNIIYMTYAGIGAVIGHCFPFYNYFKGGKGVASTFGFMLALDYRIALISFVIFILIVVLSRYISLGSITCAALNFLIWIFSYVFGFAGLTPAAFTETSIIIFLIAVTIIIRHKDNIKRLASGTENKFGKPRIK